MKLIKVALILLIINYTNCFSDTLAEFDKWKFKFKKIALEKNISEVTIDRTLSKMKFLPKVIEYDRYQPEFYEDTKTYIGKRSSNQKLDKGLKFYKKNKINLIRFM